MPTSGMHPGANFSKKPRPFSGHGAMIHDGFEGRLSHLQRRNLPVRYRPRAAPIEAASCKPLCDHSSGRPLAGHRARNSERDLAERGRARVHLDAYLSFKRTSADDVADLQFVVVCSLPWRSKKRAPPFENEGIR